MSDPNAQAQTEPKLSDRLKLIEWTPGVSVPISDEERRYMLQAVEEKEERDARQQKNDGGRNERADWWRHFMDRRS